MRRTLRRFDNHTDHDSAPPTPRVFVGGGRGGGGEGGGGGGVGEGEGGGEGEGEGEGGGEGGGGEGGESDGGGGKGGVREVLRLGKGGVREDPHQGRWLQAASLRREALGVSFDATTKFNHTS